MGIKIGIIGGSGLDNLNIFTNARDTFCLLYTSRCV